MAGLASLPPTATRATRSPAWASGPISYAELGHASVEIALEQIKRFGILERDLSEAAGELTPTIKIKRAAVYRRYAERLERLYAA